MLRTHTCGELTEKNVGAEVTLCGWVDTVRDHGGVSFIDIRDRYGKTQVVLSQKSSVKPEDCVQVSGKVALRPQGTENTKIPTGKIEVAGAKAVILNATDPLPFEVTKSTDTNEDLRMKYRFLDLRNPAVQTNLFLRHRIYQTIRRALDKHDFIEVETPILTKSTPEGARDYLVPSRVNNGEFYALPQSPQLFKQILMVSGFDRYFQIAKCFRDEDLRADRQPEFTQLDMEMSFLDENDLFTIVETVLKDILKQALDLDLPTPFARLSYQQAMSEYGSDKPDRRFEMKLQEVTEIVKGSDFKVFTESLKSADDAVVALCLKDIPKFSRSDIDALTEFAKSEGALGLPYFKCENGKLEGPLTKFFAAGILDALKEKFSVKDGDLLVFAVGNRVKAQKVLGAVRLHVRRNEKYFKDVKMSGQFDFCWVTDFPLFQWDKEEKRWVSEHHPFTSPDPEDWAKLKAGQITHDKVRSRAYDLVLNGNEIASGSIRIHNAALQNEIFDAIGLTKEEVQARFSFLLKAFRFGAPPHGGIALGIDRIITILLGLESIREVIAFPKNQKAVDPMTDAPSPVGERQLKELGIKLR